MRVITIACSRRSPMATLDTLSACKSYGLWSRVAQVEPGSDETLSELTARGWSASVNGEHLGTSRNTHAALRRAIRVAGDPGDVIVVVADSLGDLPGGAPVDLLERAWDLAGEYDVVSLTPGFGVDSRDAPAAWVVTRRVALRVATGWCHKRPSEYAWCVRRTLELGPGRRQGRELVLT